MIKFAVSPTQEIPYGKLIYTSRDYAFNFLPASSSGVTSIEIDTLQLIIDENGQVLEVFGYCPYYSWKSSNIIAPSFTRGSLFAELDEITPGISEKLAGHGEWRITFNSKSGWICVGESSLSPESIAIEFACNCVGVIEKSYLKALWLHPESLPVR